MQFFYFLRKAMAERVLKTDFKRIGRSGPTVDGRVISEKMIDEMAASYDKNLFTALIWPEHQRYVNFGMVEELRAEDNEEGGRDLFAVLSPNEFYLTSNSYGQRLFTSMEVITDFRKTGKAYLGGLGATDDPASAATSEIRFSKIADQGGVMLTQAVEATEKTFEDTVQLSLFEQFLERFSITPNEDSDMADKAAIEKLSTELAALKELFAKLTPSDNSKPEEKPEDLAAQFAALKKSHEELLEKFTALQKPSEEQAPGKAELETLKASFAALETKLNDALKEQPGTDGGEHFNVNEDASSYV
jgi:Phage capsid scaffolding protein (GPO) serine peptidase